METIPEKICTSYFDDNVCLGSIQKYFCEDARLSLLQAEECVKKHSVWYCGVCISVIMDDSEDAITSLVWHHLHETIKSTVWFCHACRAQ